MRDVHYTPLHTCHNKKANPFCFVLFCLHRIHKPKQDSGSIAVYITIIHYLSLSQSVLLFSMYFLFCVITGSDGVFLCQVLILSKLIKV